MANRKLENLQIKCQVNYQSLAEYQSTILCMQVYELEAQALEAMKRKGKQTFWFHSIDGLDQAENLGPGYYEFFVKESKELAQELRGGYIAKISFRSRTSGMEDQEFKFIAYCQNYAFIPGCSIFFIKSPSDGCVLKKLQGLSSSNKFEMSVEPLMKLSSTLKEFEAVMNLSNSLIVSIILNPHQANFNSETPGYVIDQQIESNYGSMKTPYNPTQQFCIKSILSNNNSIMLLHGPPGTGKTHTLTGCLNLILISRNFDEQLKKESGQSISRRRKIMVCAASNRALDEALLRFTQSQDSLWEKSKFVRLGFCDEYSDPLVTKYSLESQSLDLMIQQQGKKDKLLIKINVEAQRKLIEQIREVNKKIKDTEDQELKIRDLRILREKRSELSSKLIRLRNDIDEDSSDLKKAEQSVIQDSDVIFVTLNSSGNEEVQNLRNQIRWILIDECSQARESEILIPLQYEPKKLILFGDSLQLSPTVLSRYSSESKFDMSLFERLILNGVRPYFLDIQYRMHPDISFFPSKTFYYAKLQDSEEVVNRLDPECLKFLKKKRNVFIDVDNSEEKMDPYSKSFYNRGELKVVIQIVEKVYRFWIANRFKKGIDEEVQDAVPINIGVITPYNAQVRKIQKRIKKLRKQLKVSDGMKISSLATVSTVDGFQGMEQDFVILSLVRSKGDSVGFIKNFKRLNVALTRARFGLIIIGDARHIQKSTKSDDFRDLIECYRVKKSLINVDDLDDLYTTWFGDFSHKSQENRGNVCSIAGKNIPEGSHELGSSIRGESSSDEIEEGEIVLDFEKYGKTLTQKRQNKLEQQIQDAMAKGKGEIYKEQEKVDLTTSIKLPQAFEEPPEATNKSSKNQTQAPVKPVKQENRLRELIQKLQEDPKLNSE